MRSTSSPLVVSITMGIWLPVPRRRRQMDCLAGQHEIEHHQVEMLPKGALVHLGCIIDHLDIESLLAEVAPEQFAKAQVVIDDEEFDSFLFHGRNLAAPRQSG